MVRGFEMLVIFVVALASKGGIAGVCVAGQEIDQVGSRTEGDDGGSVGRRRRGFPPT